MLYLRSADAKSKRGKGAVRTGVRVAANDRHPGQRSALLGTDYMNDTLANIVHREVLLDTKFADVVIERIDLQTGDRIGDTTGTRSGRHVVVSSGENGGKAPRLAAVDPQPLEGLRTGHLMD